jgi:endonuclease YncB( thermonuclease family)
VILATRIEGAVLMIMRFAIPAAVGLALAVACVGLGNPAPPVQDDPSRFTGRVTRVVDGDTIWLDSRDVSIRIFGKIISCICERGGMLVT